MRARKRFANPSMLMAPIHARFGRLHRIVLVVNRRGGAREIVDFIDLDIERESYVVAQNFELRIVEVLRDIPTCCR